MSQYRVALDIGGTFTDVVAYNVDGGGYLVGKASTTPKDLTVGVLEALAQITDDSAAVDFAVHGTTQGLNALLERRGDRVLLLASDGAGDVYHIARGHRERMYDIHYRKRAPLVPRSDIVEIRGRLNYAGEELTPLDLDAVQAAARRAEAEAFGAIAVSFLFSYANPAHELCAGEAIKEVLPDIPISLSHRVAREWREYERTSSTVVEAYTARKVRRYLDDLEGKLRGQGLRVPLHIMQSNGGIITARSARERSLQTLLSGPVGGTMGGVALARLLERPNLICVDMGGTSFDVSLIVDGRPEISAESNLEGFPLLMPAVSIHTIGAGGGSLAYGEAGGLRVGPASAGADPGPACYGRGGTRPTVTDANLVLGRIDPETFAGGSVRLNVTAAYKAVEQLARDLGLETIELAEGICDVINAKMAQAIRTLTVEKGITPGDFSLVAFGGAGPLHAPFLARELEIPEVIVPRFPGTFSAWGMLETDIRTDFSRPYFVQLADLDPHDLSRTFNELAAEGTEALATEGIGRASQSVKHALDVRYVGQEYTLTIPLGPDIDPLSEAFDPSIRDIFHSAHQTRFGHSNPSAPIEFVVARSSAFGTVTRQEPGPPTQRILDDGAIARRGVVFGGTRQEVPVLDRQKLTEGLQIDGPAIVVEETATTIIPPDSTAVVQAFGVIRVALQPPRR